MTARHIAGLAVWLVLVGLLVLGAASRATLGRPFRWAAWAIAGLALWSALSSFWSGSVELSAIEADRMLVYLGVFLAAFLIVQTDQRRQRFAEGLAIAIALVALLGLASRLLPHVLEVGEALGSGPRLRYPLGYWNANGAMFGIGVALLLWTSRRAAWKGLQWLSVAAMPALLLALYVTYSRGSLLALGVAAGCTIVLSSDRLWMLATLGIGAIGALPAVLALQDRRSLADNIDTQTSVQQGVTVLLVLLAGIALAVLLFAALRWAERRGGQLTGRALALSRDRKVLKGIAAVLAVLAIGGAIAVGGRAWDQFSSSEAQFPYEAEKHFSEVNGAGRHDFFRVAIDAFEEKPIAGIGAGTYVFAWNEHRSIERPVHDAHSLYLEAFAELGIVGGLLVLFLVGWILWTGFSAWRAALHPQRDRYAALFGATLAFAIGAGIDWFWEIAAFGAVFFLAAAVLIAARCAQLARATAAASESGGERRFGLTVAGLAVAWITAIALIGPLLVDREIAASRSAADGGDFAAAVDHANTARSIEPFAASPYVQLGLLAELQRDYPTAKERLSQAISREDSNWQLYYLRSRVEHEAGEEAAAQADLAKARELNPRLECLRSGWECE
ncbi:MAG TPA: O-antigen ligase family protein [Solirubrobacterales bacterium]|nr:O-antigen ligase family protein [Solirubrobacterales bacterium]